MFGFLNDTYGVTEEAQAVSPTVALIDGDFGNLTVTLVAGIDESSEFNTALGTTECTKLHSSFFMLMQHYDICFCN